MIYNGNLTTQALLLFFLTILIHPLAQQKELAPFSFRDSLQNKEIQLLDVRTSEEFNQGHIAHAFQADWNNPEQFKERTASFDKHRPIYVYCLAGSRSAAAQKWLIQQGFETVYNLRGGMNAWNLEDLPVEGKKEVQQITIREFMTTIPKDKTVLVDIGAEWCPPCKKMSPVVAELSQEYPVIYVDGGSQTQLAKELGASAFPTFIAFRNGKEVNRITGVCSKEDLRKMLE